MIVDLENCTKDLDEKKIERDKIEVQIQKQLDIYKKKYRKGISHDFKNQKD